MPTETLTITCTNNPTNTDNTCTIPFSSIYSGNVASFNTPFFSSGEMFISLLLLIGLILAIITMVRKGIFSIKVHKKYLGVNQMEGKEIYKM